MFMSDAVLEQILIQLQQMNKRFDHIDQRLDNMDGHLDGMDGRLEENQASFERKVTAELNTYQHSIDILNRRQLRMEADIETLKNR